MTVTGSIATTTANREERLTPPLAGSRRRTALVHAAAAAGALVLAAIVVDRTDGRTPDDAFILFRYAQHLLDGQGWVYNLRHPTSNAVSAPLYTLAIVLVASAMGDVDMASTLLFVGTTALSGYLAFAVLRSSGMTLGGVAAMLLMIVNPWLLFTRGLETSSFICLLLLAMLLLGKGRHAAVGATLVAATLVRGDGAVFAAVVFVFLLLRTRRFPWRLMTGALAATAAWTVTSLAIGIPVIPDTLAAKFAQGRSGLWGDMLYTRGFLLAPQVFGFTQWAAIAMLLGGIGLVMLVGMSGPRLHLAPFVAGTALVFVAYGVVIRPPSYHWYYGPQLTLIALCGGIATAVLARAAAEVFQGEQAPDDRDFRPRLPQGAGKRATAAAIVITIFVAGTASLVGWRDILIGPDRPEYEQTSTWLRDHTPLEATVASAEIGVIGWYGDRDMVDFLGLLSKDSVRELAIGDAVSWLTREEPDYWVLHRPAWSGMEAAAALPWFTLAYSPVWSNDGIVVWKKVRPIAEARALFASTLEPVAQTACGRTGVSAPDDDRCRAVGSLLSLLSVRVDLRDRYAPEGKVDLAGLARWASDAAAIDQYEAAVGQPRATYDELAKAADGIDLVLPPSP